MPAQLDHHYRVYPLSPRQTQILALRAQGHTNKQIAQQLWLSEETVKDHLKRAAAKTRARNTTHAVAQAIRQGLI